MLRIHTHFILRQDSNSGKFYLVTFPRGGVLSEDVTWFIIYPKKRPVPIIGTGRRPITLRSIHQDEFSLGIKEPQPRKRPDDRPRRVELARRHAELGTYGMGVMIVVERFASRKPGENRQVIRGVWEVLRSAPMTKSVDERRENEHIKNSVQNRNQNPGLPAEAEDQEAGANAGSRPAIGEKKPVPAILWDIRSELRDCFGALCLAEIVEHVEKLTPPEPKKLGTMRVTLAIGEGVMLAVHSHPLPPILPREKPKRRTKHELEPRTQRHRPMRQPPMQIDGGGKNRRLR